MNIKRKKLVALVSGLLIITFAGVNCKKRFCHPSAEDYAKKIDWVFDKVASKLDFTDSQEKELEPIKVELKSNLKKFQISRKKIKNSIISELNSDSFNQEEINKVFDAEQSKFTSFRKSIIASLGKIHAILNEKQKKELSEKIKYFQNKCD